MSEVLAVLFFLSSERHFRTNFRTNRTRTGDFSILVRFRANFRTGRSVWIGKRRGETGYRESVPARLGARAPRLLGWDAARTRGAFDMSWPGRSIPAKLELARQARHQAGAWDE